MNEQIYIVVITKPVNSDIKVVKEVIEKAVNSAFNEAGTLMYEWSINSDELHVIERYKDKEAVLAHIKNLASLADELPKLGVTSKFYIYGEVGDEVKKLLKPRGAVFMSKIGGFIK
ncbi:hypothetical protein CCAL13119_06985 [Campylobacter sp. RM13119]|uniref:putative quinol monooxygenase n=1 Tax=Campylobacter californiensis TaxID=1032243 RepID=UPI001474D14F|nr:hypothetical protein [Campylobacter sp. RM13119]MBE3606689.1 hypothetical protein [Campylobacter sp. RM13119]